MVRPSHGVLAAGTVAADMAAVDAPTPTRRRGAQLEAAILDATWSELAESGFAGLTYEAVARRAQTSRSVIYRRWATLAELTEQAVLREVRSRVTIIASTGNFRQDIIDTLVENLNRKADIAVVASIQLAEYFKESDSSIAHIRQVMFGNRGDRLLAPIFARAEERGSLISQGYRIG